MFAYLNASQKNVQALLTTMDNAHAVDALGIILIRVKCNFLEME